MSAHPPPIPPERQPTYGGDPVRPDMADVAPAPVNDTPDQRGQTANTKQNTTNKGLQQDR